MKDKELYLEEIEVSHTLGGSQEEGLLFLLINKANVKKRLELECRCDERLKVKAVGLTGSKFGVITHVFSRDEKRGLVYYESIKRELKNCIFTCFFVVYYESLKRELKTKPIKESYFVYYDKRMSVR
jgi:hypothetical protein